MNTKATFSKPRTCRHSPRQYLRLSHEGQFLSCYVYTGITIYSLPSKKATFGPWRPNSTESEAMQPLFRKTSQHIQHFAPFKTIIPTSAAMQVLYTPAVRCLLRSSVVNAASSSANDSPSISPTLASAWHPRLIISISGLWLFLVISLTSTSISFAM